MNPQITSGGRSFQGAWLYYMHDKGGTTRQRVDWTHTLNMLTEDPDLAWKVMAYTAMSQDRLKEAAGQKRTGRKTQKPVMAYSLNWHPEQRPDRSHMLETARASLAVLGLEEHEAIIVAHRDTRHRHVHVIVNRVHPLTGLVAANSHSRRKLSEFALDYAREHGLSYSPQRKRNSEKLKRGEPTSYRNPVIQEAWSRSDSGAAFRAALLQHGYSLARGRKRIVVVDKYGKTHNPVRHIEGIRARDIEGRLSDLRLFQLPKADSLSRQIQANLRLRYEQSRRHDWWASHAENDVQDRHFEQRARLSDKLDDHIQAKRRDLEEFYKIKVQKEAITELEKQIEKPSIWDRVSGREKRRRDDISLRRASLDNAVMRLDEVVSAAENQKRRALKSQDETYEREKALVRASIRERRPDGYMDEGEREVLRRELPGVARQQNGPELDR